ncbi:hypothetical protein QOZ80_5AG0385560 [Eleusine coracana subsp. coracana]|nr:hypothetical protein QOZ80_5AG0385560 [Eleusine coracana subsp. coracana]
MARVSSLALVFFLSTILTVRSAATSSDAIQRLCNATSYPENCIKTLAPSRRRLAEMGYVFLAKNGPLLLAETGREYAAAVEKKNQTLITCFGTLNGNLETVVADLCGLEPECGDAEFAELKQTLDDHLSSPSSDGVSCGDEVLYKEKPLIGQVYNYNSMMQITLDLMKAA